VLKVLLTANNLGSQTGFTALAQKALMSDPSDPKSLANQLSSTNGHWLTAAQTYDFAKNGLAGLQDPKVQATLTKAYAQIQWQQSLDQQTPGLSSAMQFQSNAASIKTVDQILGDPVNRDVVLTLRGRLAWAHDWVSDPSLIAAFQALPAISRARPANGLAPEGAALDPAAEVVGGEIGGEVIGAQHGPVGRHAMPSVGERGRDIGSTETRRAVDRRLEHVAASTAETIRQTIIGGTAAERKTHDRVGQYSIIGTGCETVGACGPIMKTEICIAVCLIATAIGSAPDSPAARVEVRDRELAESVRILNVSRLVKLSYRDSGMAGTPDNQHPHSFHQASLDEAVSRVVAVVREERPQVIVTYDERGGYGHPDHVRAHQVAVAAFHAAGDGEQFPDSGAVWQTSKLYYAVIPRSAMRQFAERLRAAGVEAPFVDMRENDEELPFGVADELVTTQIDVSAYVEAKRSALTAHRTQMGPNQFFMRLPRELFWDAFGRETFQRVAGPGPTPEHDLFKAL